MIELVNNNNGKVEMGQVCNSGVQDHSKLKNRNLPNQHTIESITGLREALDNQSGEKPWKFIGTQTADGETTQIEFNGFEARELKIVFTSKGKFANQSLLIASDNGIASWRPYAFSQAFNNSDYTTVISIGPMLKSPAPPIGEAVFKGLCEVSFTLPEYMQVYTATPTWSRATNSLTIGRNDEILTNLKIDVSMPIQEGWTVSLEVR